MISILIPSYTIFADTSKKFYDFNSGICWSMYLCYDIMHLFLTPIYIFINSQMQPKYTNWTFIWNVHILYLNWDIRNKTNSYKRKINNWNNNKKRNLMTWKQSRKSLCSFVCICSLILKKAEENWTIRTLSMSVCAHKTPHTTFNNTVPSIVLCVFYTRFVPWGSPYIESWHMRLNENAHVGGNA